MQKQKTMSWLGRYSMFLAALGLGIGTQQRGETLNALVRTVIPAQQVIPLTQPRDVLSQIYPSPELL